MKTVRSIGMDLPIIAELAGGWFLAAHPNGACIASHDVISVLRPDRTVEGDYIHDVIPLVVKCDAIDKFERFAWPLIKSKFYPEDKEI